MKVLSFFFLLALFGAVCTKKVRKNVPYNPALETFTWRNRGLNQNHVFPLAPDPRLTKDFLFKQVEPILRVNHFTTRIKRTKASVGCAAKNLAFHWYKNVPPNFCSIKPVLVYNEVHSGSSLLASAMNEVDSVVYAHEFFCCDGGTDGCKNKTLSFPMYTNLLCSLQLPSRGVKTAMVSVERQHFWGHPEGYNYPIESKTPVVFLLRQNSLASLLSLSGFHGKKSEPQRIRTKVIQKLMRFHDYSRNTFLRLYCRLGKAGVPVKIISYEGLAENFTSTVQSVMDFVGAEGEVPRRSPRRSSHTPIKQKIENVEAVRDFMVGLDSGFECLLDETCGFPSELDCSKIELKALKLAKEFQSTPLER